MSYNSEYQPQPFNPLDKIHLGESVAQAVIQSPVHKLPPESFIGAGVYAIYYTGDFSAYKRLTSYNQDDKFLWPIYVGKAVPDGARKGGFGLGADPGKALAKRLNDHAKSVQQANNLNLDDFYCRYLVVDDIWIPLAENMLIEKFSPLWNMSLDGFGNHDPGRGRLNSKRPQWDTLHPGRGWAAKLSPNPLADIELMQNVDSFLEAKEKEIFSKPIVLDE